MSFYEQSDKNDCLPAVRQTRGSVHKDRMLAWNFSLLIFVPV